MAKKETLYLAYGSNMNQTQMAFRCPTASVVGTGVLKDYELRFRGSRRGAVATVEPQKGSEVPVLLWKIRQADEEALDRYEGFPRLYGKENLQIEIGGETVSAMGYVMRPCYELGVPSEGYAGVIRQGYEQCGLDPAPLEAAIERACDMAAGYGKEMSQASGQEMSGMNQTM